MTYESMIVETIKINGHNSDAINAYDQRLKQLDEKNQLCDRCMSVINEN